MRASVEQVQQILILLGSVEARRRRVDILEMSREDASEFIRKLARSSTGDKRLTSTGGRPARPLDQLKPHQQRLIAELQANPNDPRHGSQYAYGAGRCKCDRCKRAGLKRQ